MESCGLARVEELLGPRARVVVDRQEACAHCQSADLCNTLGGRGTMRVIVDNPVGARVGQVVELSSSRSGGLKAAFVVYLLPAVLFVAGVAVGSEGLGWRPLHSGLLGLGALGVSWVLAWLYDRRARTNAEFRVVITRIVGDGRGAPAQES